MSDWFIVEWRYDFSISSRPPGLLLRTADYEDWIGIASEAYRNLAELSLVGIVIRLYHADLDAVIHIDRLSVKTDIMNDIFRLGNLMVSVFFLVIQRHARLLHVGRLEQEPPAVLQIIALGIDLSLVVVEIHQSAL